MIYNIPAHDMKPVSITALALAASLLFNVAANANEAREITWDDLVPPEAQFDLHNRGEPGGVRHTGIFREVRCAPADIELP